jgi:ribonuclease G
VTRQIVINAAPWETRVAVLDDSTLSELYVERGRDHGIAGNIYKGKVVRVLPGMQAAFVDVGLDKAAFLHVSDLLPPTEAEPVAPDEEIVETVTAEDAEPIADEPGAADADDDAAPGPRRRAPLPPIEERLSKGDELLVQVAKEPIGTKGARVTAWISLPGRHLVLMPGTRHVGISRRIEDPAERDRLRAIMEAERPAEGGFIVRTACEGASRRDIHDDVRFLTRLWARITKTAATTPAPALIHQDLDVVLRCVRDLFTSDVERLTIDAAADHARVYEFVETTMPKLATRVHHYQGATPIFDQHGIETKITRALDRRVWLKSGGYLVIEQTESLTAIDVNTGRYVGKKSQEETILKTNLEAAKQVVTQLRLRNLGGIIVIDFIDMESTESRAEVFEALQQAMRADKARTNILRISELGLVEMTRKRTRESLGQLVSTPCPHCEGAGRVRSVETLAYAALRRVQHEAASHTGTGPLVLRVPPDVAAFLSGAGADSLPALEALIGRPVTVEAAPDLPAVDAQVRSATARAGSG